MKRILLIDDEEMNQMSTKFTLEKAGYEVVAVGSGDEGLALLDELFFDMLLLDIEMPGKSGIEVLREIRGSGRHQGLRVMFLTASEDNADMKEAASLGSIGFIKKPCLPTELTHAVDTAFLESEQEHILAVDDEVINHMIIKKIFGEEYRVTCLFSGEDALEFLEHDIPAMILMDLKMPGMDGAKTFQKIREVEKWKDIPVAFLTADEEEGVELELLQMGAMDFIRKPFVAGIVKTRICRIMELRRLQTLVEDEVQRKTNDLKQSNRKIKRLSEQVIFALASAIDAKDAYTNGHSNRVAQYSRQIARRMGKSEEEVNDTYFAGLLHDVGKIGIPAEIINKPGRLTDEEYDIIKTHTTKGDNILTQISELPSLHIGARWHHERYDGKGYPDGLKGADIPEIARIICVADCYDAMSSNRSYRKGLAQAIVRSEIERNKGLQFDPAIADIMLQMIDEDTEYRMREM